MKLLHTIGDKLFQTGILLAMTVMTIGSVWMFIAFLIPRHAQTIDIFLHKEEAQATVINSQEYTVYSSGSTHTYKNYTIRFTTQAGTIYTVEDKLAHNLNELVPETEKVTYSSLHPKETATTSFGQDIFTVIFLTPVFLFMPFVALILIKELLDLLPHSCAVCKKKKAKDMLIEDGKKQTYYCREHLIQKFSEEFKASPLTFVLFHPEQTRRYCQNLYPYYPVDEMKKLDFQDSTIYWVKDALATIRGECENCKTHSAEVVYFKKGLLQWNNQGPVPEKTKIEEGERVCKNCALEKIHTDLQNAKKPYSEGLYTPYHQNGVYVNTFV